MGLRFQEAVLKKVAEYKSCSYRLAEPGEEASGIDGYISDTAVSIKPITYKTKMALPKQISVQVIFYQKDKNGINIEFEDI